MKTLSIASILMTAFFCSCATRGVHDQYFGATEQRLMTHSIDKLLKELPEKDFNPLKGQTIFLECYFPVDKEILAYAKKRFEMELMEKYACKLAETPEGAEKILNVFFTAIGTDQDKMGFSTPEFMVPGASGTVTIDLISLDMYHGVSELYYYIIDPKTLAAVRGDKIKAIIRTDKLALPIISIPINTLD